MNKEESAIIVKDVHKSFRLPHEQHSGVKQALVNIFTHDRGFETRKVLGDVSFSIKKGEFFGIVGRNGSGKSTLLKLLAGIYTPDSGLVQVNGSLTPFIELGVGFNPELTGRENIFLNGALLGFSREEMSGMYDEIVEFAELTDFMDQKLKNYSSGMQVRLAFSIAIRAKSEILLLDEILAVGDEAFQKKCIDYFYRIKNNDQTTILVTHDMTNVERFCDRVLVLDDGKVLGMYDAAKAKIVYEQLNRPESASFDKDEEVVIDKRWGTGEVKISAIRVNGSESDDIVVDHAKELRIDIDLEATHKKRVVVGLAVYDANGIVLAGPNSGTMKIISSDSVQYVVPLNPLNPGDYFLRAAVLDTNQQVIYDHIEDAVRIKIASLGTTLHGKVDMFGQWNIKGKD